MSGNFGTNADLKLDVLNTILRAELVGINNTLGIDYEYGPFRFQKATSDKGYVARADVEIRNQPDGLQGKKLVAVILLPNGGTGDRGSYQNYPYLDACWTPRKKTGIEAEAYFSIGTGYNDSWFPGLTSLSAVGLLNPGNPTHPIKEYKRLTTGTLDFRNGLVRRVDSERLRRLSFVMNRQENRPEDVGDPHAVIFDYRKSFANIEGYSNFFQIGAFLSFTEPSPALDRLKKDHARHLGTLVRQYEHHHKP